MRGLRPEWIGALAGIALVVLLFLPWYELDAEGSSTGVQGVLSTFAGGDTDATAWDTLPRVSLVWIASALAALAAALVPWLGGGALATRWVTATAVGIAVVGFVFAAMRLLDPPLQSYTVSAPAYAAGAMSAILLATAVLSLRRT